MPLTLLSAPPDSKIYLHLCICIAKIIKLCKRNKKNQIRISHYIKHIKTSNTKPSCMDLAIKKMQAQFWGSFVDSSPSLEIFFMNLIPHGLFY